MDAVLEISPIFPITHDIAFQNKQSSVSWFADFIHYKK